MPPAGNRKVIRAHPLELMIGTHAQNLGVFSLGVGVVLQKQIAVRQAKPNILLDSNRQVIYLTLG